MKSEISIIKLYFMLISPNSRHLFVCGLYSSIELQNVSDENNHDHNHDRNHDSF